MTGFSRFLLTAFGLLCAAGGVAMIVESTKPPPFTPAAAPKAMPSREPPRPTVFRSEVLDRLPVTKRVFRGSGGDPLTGTFTVENKNDFAIKDFTIRFTFYGNSGTMISSRNQTFYEIVPAKGAKSFRNVRLGFMPDQGTTTSAEVVDYGAP